MDCYLVLKTVQDLDCSPESYEDCTDVLKKVRHAASEEEEDFPPQVPYFENVEECVEVPIEICYDVDEQVSTGNCQLKMAASTTCDIANRNHSTILTGSSKTRRNTVFLHN